MAHPHIEQAVPLRIGPVLYIAQQGRVSLCANLRITKFAHQTIFDFAAQLRGHRLHAIADSQHRYTQFKYDLWRAWRVSLGDRIRTAGKYDPCRVEITNEIYIDIIRMQLAVNVGFTDAARDKLRVLRAEIEDQDFFMGGHLVAKR